MGRVTEMKSVVGFGKLFADMADKAEGKKKQARSAKKPKQVYKMDLGNTDAGRDLAQGPAEPKREEWGMGELSRMSIREIPPSHGHSSKGRFRGRGRL